MVGKVVKANIGDLEKEANEIFSISTREQVTDVVQVVYWKKTLLVRFQYVCKNYLTLNQLIIIIVDKVLWEEEPEVPTITEMLEEEVTYRIMDTAVGLERFLLFEVARDGGVIPKFHRAEKCILSRGMGTKIRQCQGSIHSRHRVSGQ